MNLKTEFALLKLGDIANGGNGYISAETAQLILEYMNGEYKRGIADAESRMKAFNPDDWNVVTLSLNAQMKGDDL